MKKERLLRVLDFAIVASMFWLVWFLDFPNDYGKHTLRIFWEMRSELFRTGTSVLWLAVTWLGMYRSWDEAKRVSGPVMLLGVALLLTVLALPYATRLIIWRYRKRVMQEVYGAVMLCMTGVAYGLQLALERANPDAQACVEASRAYRRSLVLAFVIQAIGLVASMTFLGRATWYAAAVADLCVLGMWIVGQVRASGQSPTK